MQRAAVGEVALNPQIIAETWSKGRNIRALFHQLGLQPKLIEPVHLYGQPREPKNCLKILGSFFSLGPGLALFVSQPARPHLTGLAVRGEREPHLVRVVPFINPQDNCSFDFWYCEGDLGGEFANWRKAGFSVFVEENLGSFSLFPMGIPRDQWQIKLKPFFDRTLPPP